MPDEMLTAEALSAEIRVPAKTLAQWRYRGEGPHYLKLGGHVRYRRTDVNAWLTSCEKGTPDEAA